FSFIVNKAWKQENKLIMQPLSQKKLQHVIVLDACFCRNKNSKLGHRKVSNDLKLNRVSSLWVNELTVPARNVPG
ncbi:MAG: hypothetical protein ACK559_13075, partial [bacterium]